MSIVRMRKVFRKKIQIKLGKRRFSLGSPMEIVFWVIVVIFLVGAFYTFGGPASQDRGEDQQAGPRKVSRIVAVVNGEKITREEFDKLYVPQATEMSQADLVMRDRYTKKSILDSMVDRMLRLAAARKEGVTVSRDDIRAKIEELVQQEVGQRFPTRRALATHLRRNKITLDQYKADLRRKLNDNRKDVEEQVLFDGLEKKVKDRVQVSDKDLEDSYMRAKARHILIMPDRLKADDEKNQPKDKKPQQQPKKDYKAEAKKRAEEIAKRLRAGEDFAKLAKEFSHDPSSANKGGMLMGPPPPGAPPTVKEGEYFDPATMVPEFRKAVQTLPLNQISDPVESSYGFHVIQVLDRKVELPKDFQQKKEDYRKTLLEQRKTEAWAEYLQNLKKTATIDIQDPELKAYELLDQDKTPEAIQLLAQAVNDDPTNIGAKYQLAMLLLETSEKEQAIKYLKELSENDRAASCPQVHARLGDLYMEKKLTKEAIEAYTSASSMAEAFDYENEFMHQDLKAKFEKLGAKELAAKEQQWLDDYNKYKAENPDMGGMGMPFTLPPSGGGS